MKIREKMTINPDDIKIRKRMAGPVKVHNPKKEYKRISEHELWEQLEEEEYADY